MLDGGEGVVNELNASVGFVIQFVEDISVEDKEGDDGVSAAEGVVEGGVIVQPQVASKPADGDGHGFETSEALKWFVGVWGEIKKPSGKPEGSKEYGSYLLSRIVVQYHRP